MSPSTSGSGTSSSQAMCCLAEIDCGLVARLNSMYHHDEESFQRRFLGPPGAACLRTCSALVSEAIERFWDAQRGTRWFQDHPILSQPVSWWRLVSWMVAEDINLSYMIPLLFHGDDADSHRRRSFYVCTLTSPLCEYEGSWDSRILLCTLDNSRCLPETYDVVDTWMVYGFTELQEGSFFSVDPWGEEFVRGKTGPCCGPYRAVLAGIKGDEKFVQRTLKLTTSWISEGVCLYCAAQKSGRLLYTQFGPRAPHRQTLVTNEEFFAKGCRPNAWIRLPGFHVERIFLDWLHLVDLALTPESAASAPCMTRQTRVVFRSRIDSLKTRFLRRLWNLRAAHKFGEQRARMSGFALPSLTSRVCVAATGSVSWTLNVSSHRLRSLRLRKQRPHLLDVPWIRRCCQRVMAEEEFLLERQRELPLPNAEAL